LILDTMGMLSSAYRYADFALVGGGFRGALHNILEPAVWGCHLSFGPNTKKFPEAEEFIGQGFAEHISTSEQWINRIGALVKDNSELTSIQDKAKEYTAAQVGASKTILDNIG